MSKGKPYSLYRRKKVYYVRFKLPGNRWSTAKSTGETVRGKAERWAYNYLSAGQIVRRENILFSEYAKDFFSWEGPWATDKLATGKRIGPRHCKERDIVLRNSLLPAFGNMKLTDITRALIKEFRNTMYTKGYAGSTINKALSTLKTILEAAEEQSLIQFVPKIERASDRPEKHRGILTVEEVRQIFSLPWRDARAYTMNLMAASTGLRLGELQALTVKDVNLDGRYITVSRSWDRRTRTMNETTKTGRSRTVIIPENLCHLLKRLIDQNPWDEGEKYIFYSNVSPLKPVSENIITGGLFSMMKKIGISYEQRQERYITFHSWRHWFNSLLVNAKIPLQKVQSLTGHLTAEMTQHYYHSDDMGDVVGVVQDSLYSALPANAGEIN